MSPDIKGKLFLWGGALTQEDKGKHMSLLYESTVFSSTSNPNWNFVEWPEFLRISKYISGARNSNY
jgi:hypothetical protein